MKLDHDCVRDVLIYIEDKHKMGSFLHLDDFLDAKELHKYDPDEIKYVLLKLLEAKYIEASPPAYSNGILVEFSCGGLSWDGHQFLENIKDPKIWKKTKKAASKVASASLTILSSLAASILSKYLGI